MNIRYLPICEENFEGQSIMSSILKFIGIKQPSLDELYLRGMDAYAAKNYQNALYYFDQVFKKSKNPTTRINVLTNTAIIKENLNRHKEASEYYFQSALLMAKELRPNKEIIDSLKKAYKQRVKAGRENMGVIVAPLMFYAIATLDFELARKGYDRMTALISDPLTNLAVKAWEELQKRDKSIVEKTSLFSIPAKYPQEMQYIISEAEKVIRAYASLEITLSAPTKGIIKAGEIIKIDLLLKSHYNVEISKLNFNTGSKGIITKFPFEHEKIKLLKNAKKVINLELEAQLTGKWEIGPAEAIYLSDAHEFKIESNVINVVVQEGIAKLELDLQYVVVEEDFEYDIFSHLINQGKSTLENIKVGLRIPSEKIAKFTDGSSEKTLFQLSPGEEFKFSNRIRFEAGILGKKYTIKLVATYGTETVEKELVLQGLPQQPEGSTMKNNP